MTLAVCLGPALEMPHNVAPVEPRLSPMPSTSRLAMRLVRLSHAGLRWGNAAPSIKRPLRVQAPMPHRHEVFAPLWSEMRPAQGRLREGAMDWVVLAGA